VPKTRPPVKRAAAAAATICSLSGSVGHGAQCSSIADESFAAALSPGRRGRGKLHNLSRSVLTASVEGGEHIGADQGHTPIAAIEALRVQLRVFADHQPLLDAAAAVDDHLVQPRVAPDENVRE
jgi:hypothetical protein